MQLKSLEKLSKQGTPLHYTCSNSYRLLKPESFLGQEQSCLLCLNIFLPACWFGLAITTTHILKKDWCGPDTNAWYRRCPIPKHQRQASACLGLSFLLKCSCCGMVVLGSRGGEQSMEIETFPLGGKVCLPCDPEVPQLNDSVSMFALIDRSRN